MKTSQVSLPHFEHFNQAAEDEEFFARILAGETSDDLPQEDVFIVSHSMARDAPYLRRDYFELVYVLEGRVTDRIERQDLQLLPDSLCLVCPYTLHGLIATDQNAIVVVIGLRPKLFAEGVFAQLLAQDTPVSRIMRGQDDHGFMIFSDTYGRILYRSIRTLLKEYDHAGQKANFSVLARVLLLLDQLSQIETYSFYGLDQRMMEVIEYVRVHCASVDVSSLAAHFGYSETYFSSLVHRRCGVRARELIVAARLRRARELLVTTDLPVTDVAQAVGYESYSHFNRIFRATYAITPAAYRAYAAWGRDARPSRAV